MKDIKNEMKFLKRLLDMLEQQLGEKYEIILHDLTGDYEHTIVDIRNGHITGRRIGDCGSNLGLEVLRGSVKDGDRYNYITHTKDGKILRSSTTYVRDDNDKIVGAICINFDITEMVQMENILKKFNQYNIYETEEVFVSDVNELLGHLLQEAQKHIGKPVVLMSKEEKISMVKFLDEKGAFLITKSGDRVCEFLNISKYTLYSYLDSIKRNNNADIQIK